MRSRPLAILLCVVVLISTLFVVSSSAAGVDSLIESDLRQWSNTSDKYVISSTKKGDICRLDFSGPNGVIYELPSFIAGHSYTLNFHIPSASEISMAWGQEYTTDNIISHFKNSVVMVGYGFLDPSGKSVEVQHVIFEFDSSNISNYIGQDLSASFVAGSSSGRPVVFINISTSDSNLHRFFFSDFSMYDNDDNSGEIKGILGLLHSLRWDTFGGVCDSDDCSHSIVGNPHLSLTERMAAGFSNFFDFLASKFEEGSTLNSWFNGLSSGVTNLGNNVNGWLSGLGNSINSKLGNVLSGITTSLSDLGVNIDGFIDGAVSVIDSLFQKIFDFTDTFKPRVYERFRWQRGIINFNTGEFTLKNNNYPYAIVSDFFTVEPGTKVFLDYEHLSELESLAIFKYDYYGNFVGTQIVSSSTSGIELASGYLYRFCVGYPSNLTDLSSINQYVRVYTDEGWIMSVIHWWESFLDGCVNMLLYFNWYGDYYNPFVEDLPFVEFISSFFDSITQFISDSLERYLSFKVKSHAFNILFSYVLEEIPILFVIGSASLFLVVVSRFIGI